MKIFKIYKKNLKNIVKNPAALVVVLGLCIIPSLYAWITLKANWDPYVDTGNVPVAIVNEDKGTIINNQIVNVGDQIVNQLKQNKSIKWTFVGEAVANEGLKSGEYYAVIIIPSDFSSDLATLSTGTPVKPDIIYKVNEKTNAIATKITDIAASQLQQQIKESFVKSVNEAVIKEANVVGKEIKKNEPMILQLKDVIASTNNNIGKIENNISGATVNVNELNSYLNNVQKNLPTITNAINSLQQVTAASQGLIQSTKNTVSNANNNINSNISQMESTNTQLQGFISSLKELNATASNNESTIQLINNALGANERLSGTVNSTIGLLQSLNNLLQNNALSGLIGQLNQTASQLNEQRTELNTLKTNLADKAPAEKVEGVLNNISNVSNGLTSDISNFAHNFTANGTATVNGLTNNLNLSLNNVNSILESSRAIVPQLKALTDLGISAGNLTTEKTQELSKKLNSFKGTLSELQDKTKGLNSEALDNLVNVLEKNPNDISSFLSSPVSIKVEELYGMSVFGIGLAPFYTVLSIWVGALLLTSLLKAGDPEEEDGTKKTLMEIHFGKMLVFLTINFIQATIVTLGDVYLLGISPYSIWMLLGFAWLSGITFTVIIFTLVSLMGNMGKALCIVIMVMQVAGTGAIYPIQVNPEIFQKLYYVWPFTYAIDAFRESIGGPDMSRVMHDLKILLIFLIVFLALGFLQIIMHKNTEKMEELFKESGL
ncbi:YhgE/Pip domain-containing protein [Clostridium sp.]|uniref:YhgE/Pip domain-containing protein n=1 Tax=Clostridium sp. TaxID=1506 RepID=UPI003990E2C3